MITQKKKLKILEIVQDFLTYEKSHLNDLKPIVKTLTSPINQKLTFGDDNSLMLIQIISNGDEGDLFHNGIKINESFHIDNSDFYLVNKIELTNTIDELKAQIIGYRFFSRR